MPSNAAYSQEQCNKRFINAYVCIRYADVKLLDLWHLLRLICILCLFLSSPFTCASTTRQSRCKKISVLHKLYVHGQTPIWDNFDYIRFEVHTSSFPHMWEQRCSYNHWCNQRWICFANNWMFRKKQNLWPLPRHPSRMKGLHELRWKNDKKCRKNSTIGRILYMKHT